MKKIPHLLLAVSLWSTAHAQIITKPHGNNTSGQQASSTAKTLSDADYFLAVTRITIATGQDNKDNGAKLILRVYPTQGTDNYRKGYQQDNFTRELKRWTTDEIPLSRAGEFDQSFNTLANYRKTGVMVDILYDTWGGPYPPLDAWKIEEVSVTLEFKDKDGNPHPTMGSKIIHFPGSNVYLDFTKWHLFCKTDQYFNALPPFVTKRQ